MKCPYCQKELPEESKFCSFCGNEIKDNKKICPECQNEENIDAIYCSQCGYNFLKKDNEQLNDKKEDEELSRVKKKNKKKDHKKLYIIIGIIIALFVLAGATYFVFFKEDKTATETVSTKNNKKEELILKETKFELEVGKQDYIEANMSCTYKVKNEKIVEVDSFGTITAKATGTTTVTVKASNGNSVKCTVTVKEGPQKIEIESYQASSTLVASGYDYSVSHLYDDDISTCWSEGVDGEGLGETITVTFKEEVNVNTMQIMNGISKNKELYQKNGRLKKVTLIFDDGNEENVEIKDSYKEIQTIKFNEHKTKNITIKIDEIYQGTKYQDTCITKLLFSYQK